jgi:uncharacterized Zn finger protein
VTSAGGWGEERWPRSEPRRPGTGAKRAGRKAFGATWWGAAWVDAIEHRAALDPNRLPRGRSYARAGQADQLEMSEGEVRSLVQGSRPEPYAVRVRVRVFTGDEWDRVLDALAAQAGHTAALLDGELLPDVAEDVRRAGLDLLPGPGEVQPRCTCPDWADPCKHAAAVCYLVADELDRDPFGVLLLRGRGRTEVMAALRSRRGGLGPRAASTVDPGDDTTDAGVVATAAWARSPDPLPRIPSPPPAPGHPTVLAVDPPPGQGVQAEALRALAADAARRAWSLAVGLPPEPSAPTLDHDLARWAAATLEPDRSPPRALSGPAAAGPAPAAPAAAGPALAGPALAGPALADLAHRAGLPGRQLLRRALAWRAGGAGGVDALLVAWDPPADTVAEGRAGLDAGAVARRNRLTSGDRQLRLGRDGRWYPFRRAAGGWDPHGAPMTPEDLGGG